ncbi:MAG: phospholipase D family protein [Gammaproteobacteria bacterium]|nr:phospholipase D family protein [Gammaproteobacteria bacterium]
MQYFIWHADIIGNYLFDAMLSAADRGVRVRILLDDISIDKETQNILYAMDQHENIEVRLYNPFASRGFHLPDFIFSGPRINRRMHNKSFTVDNQVTIVGGRNIGNEYFSADEISNFTDIDVISVGAVVGDVEKQFDIYWNSDVVYPVKAFDHNKANAEDLAQLRDKFADFIVANDESKYSLDIRDTEMYKHINDFEIWSPYQQNMFSGKLKVIYDDPEKSLGKSEDEIVYLKSLMKPYLEGVNTSLELVSPYFVPGKTGAQYLVGLVEKGIIVRVLTNSLSSTDGILAQSGYSRHRRRLLEGGVELYELKADSKTKASRSLRRSGEAKSGLHAKTYIFDRKDIFIGSFNFDQRSANINAEVGIVYEIPEMAELLSTSIFEDSLKEYTFRVQLSDTNPGQIEWVEYKTGVEIRHSKDPYTSGWRRFNESVFSILPIESQL